MTLISTVTVGSGGAASIDFTGIVGTATDLVLLLSLRATTDVAGTYNFVNMNVNSSGTNFNRRLLQGTGSSAASFSDTTDRQIALINGNSSTASTFSNHSVYFPNYSGSTQKSFSVDSVHETNATAAYQQLQAIIWPSTAAITSLTLTPTSGNFAQHSLASLYSVTKGSGGATVS
jgi:hypothetical protein